MADFELLRHVTIGQYLPGDSVVHRLDPRAKLLATLALVAAIAMATAYLGHLALLLGILALIGLAGIPMGFALGGLRPAMGMILFLAVMQVLFYDTYLGATPSLVLWAWGPASVSLAGLNLALITILRLVEMMLVVSLLTLTTSTTSLSRAVESLLSPLARLGFPAHEAAMASTIALRFVPTLAEELEKIAKAQASRGADLGDQGRFQFIQRLRRLVPLLVPLFITSFRRAEELVEAMEARAYSGGRGRSSYRRLHARSLDYAAVLVTVLLAAALVLTPLPL